MPDTVDYQARYTSPADCAADPSLSPSEKRAILEGWRLDALRLSESTAEGMDDPPHDRTMLSEVDRALELLEDDG